MKTVAQGLSSLKMSIWLMPLLCMGCATLTPEIREQEKTLAMSMPAQYGDFSNFHGLEAEGDIAHGQKNQSVSSSEQVASVPVQELVAPRQDAWWTDFNSQDLNKLIEKSLTTNFDIGKAWASLRQSEATARVARAALFPSLDGSGSAGTNRTSTQANTSSSRNEDSVESYGLGLAASYELDLWGRVNAEREAELLRLQATAYDLETMHMTVAASVATAWASLLGKHAELEVVEAQIDINTDIAALQHVRFMNGLSTSLDVLQQQEVLASLKAAIPSLEQEAVILRNELAILQGALPSTGIVINEKADLPHIGDIPAVGLPIQLLDARPDIKAAWARLEAADWDVTEARANRYPSISLSASMLFNAAESAVLFSNWIAALTGSLAMPIFDGGALAATEERARAVADELVQSYAQTVATAMKEVGDALATEQGAKKTLHRLQEQLAFATAARNEARNGYLGGTTDFLNYITEVKNVQSLERSLAQQKTSLVQARITLNRTLGGLTFPQAMNAAGVK